MLITIVANLGRKVMLAHRALKLSLRFAALLVLPGMILAQTTTDANSLNGYYGSVVVTPSPSLHRVVVVLNSNAQLTQKSNQIVFVVQGEFPNYPEAWTGNAHVMASSNMLVISSINTSGKAEKIAFKFAENSLPSTIGQEQFQVYSSYGIARYGEVSPLSQKQIGELITKGRIAQ